MNISSFAVLSFSGFSSSLQFHLYQLSISYCPTVHRFFHFMSFSFSSFTYNSSYSSPLSDPHIACTASITFRSSSVVEIPHLHFSFQTSCAASLHFIVILLAPFVLGLCTFFNLHPSSFSVPCWHLSSSLYSPFLPCPWSKIFCISGTCLCCIP